jgi:hypothetical protein
MSTLLSSTITTCSKAARDIVASAGRTPTRYITSVASVVVLGLALACSDNSQNPVAPTPSVSIPGPSFGTVLAGNGPGKCLLGDTQDAGYLNNVTSLNCTSNDVDISFATITQYRINGGSFQSLPQGQQISCVPGDLIDAVTTAFIANSAQERYDFGLWINPAADSSAYTGGSCLHFNLISGGASGAVEIDETPDDCGDIAGSDTVSIPLDTLHLTCPGGGKTSLSVDACAAWSNGTTGSNDRICPAPAAPNVPTGFRWGTTPGTTAKCRCEPLVLPIDVKGVLRIEKQTLPDGSSQSFTFTPNYNSGTTFNLTDGQTNNSPPLSAGTYTAAETVPSGWTLTNRECHLTGTATNKTFTSITNGVSVALGAGEDVTCVFTNTKIPTLTVNKVCVPTTDGGAFNLQIDAATAGTGANAACGGTTGAVEQTIGTHTAGETAGTGTNLSNYTTVIGGDCASNGSVTLAAGDAKTCTITNTRKPTLTVNKVCVPTSDTGKFNLRIDGSTAGTGGDASCGGTTGAIVTSIGTHTASETAGTGTSLADYASVIGGDCASDGTVSLAAGQNKTCTITNTKKATLTVNKVCVPTTDGGKFNLQIDAATAGTGANASCGGTTGAVTVTATSHTVGETQGTSTLLSNYTTVISGDCNSAGVVSLNPGDNKTCTITNTRKPTLTVNKVCAPTNDAGKFNLQIDAATAGTGTDASCGGTTGAVVTTIGSHTAGETQGTGTLLSNYTTVIGGDCASDGSVTLAAGDNKTCTITNTRKPRLTINKVCVPTSDTGKFNLQLDAVTKTADAACGGTTGTIISSIGGHTVGETAGTGTSLTSYSSAISGDCASDGSITLAAGDNKTCTITNSRLPNLTVRKVVIGAGATFNFSGTGTGVTANFSLSPAADDSAQTTFSNIAIGAKSITETILAGYVLTDLGCDKGGVIYDPLVTQTVNVTLDYGDNVICRYVNQQQLSQTTRTQGFWATHTSLANIAWFGGTAFGNTFPGVANTDLGDILLCGRSIDTLPKLMGGFWSGISMTSTKSKRSSLDQARMRLLQQLLAAELNHSAFGSSPTGSISIQQAEDAYCGTDITAINAAASAMAAFNESGDSGAFTPGTSADAKNAKTIALLSFWDVLP